MSRASVLRFSFASLVSLALGGCVTPRLVAPLRYAAASPAPDEPFRAGPPAVPPVTEMNEPVRETTLPNGVRVVLIERHDAPMVATELVIDRGALDVDDAGGRAVAETLYLFARGGDQATSDELFAGSTGVGATWSSNVAADSSSTTVSAPSRSFDAALGLLARKCVGARLSPPEYQRRAAELRQSAAWGGVSLVTMEKAILFGRDHAYGYRPAAKEPLSLSAAQALHDRLFQPTQATLIVVGDVTAAEVDASATRWLGGWKATQAIPRNTISPPPQNGPRVAVVSRRDRTQRSVAIFARGPTAAADDLAAFDLASLILGGERSSPLAEQLSEGSSAAYGVEAPVFVSRTATWLSIAASYQDDNAVDGTRDVLAAIDALRKGHVTDEDVALARETFLASWRGTMSSTVGTAALYALWLTAGLAPNRIGERLSGIARVTREDVIRVANTYLAPMAVHVGILGEDRWLNVAPLGMGGAQVLDMEK